MTIDVKSMVKRGHCPDCGNPWWFDKGNLGFVCSTCAKTIGKSGISQSEMKRIRVQQGLPMYPGDGDEK